MKSRESLKKSKPKSKKQKRNRRSITKYPALRPEFNLKTRFDLIEMDQKYKNEIMANPEAAEWLNQFNEEFVNASFNKYEKSLHPTIESKRECYKSNNARNRCIYTREKAQGKLNYTEDIKEILDNQFLDYSDSLIMKLDGVPFEEVAPAPKKRVRINKTRSNRNKSSKTNNKLKI